MFLFCFILETELPSPKRSEGEGSGVRRASEQQPLAATYKIFLSAKGEGPGHGGRDRRGGSEALSADR